MPYNPVELERFVIDNTQDGIVSIIPPNYFDPDRWQIALYLSRTGSSNFTEADYLGYTRSTIGTFSGPISLAGKIGWRSEGVNFFQPASGITLSRDIMGVALVGSDAGDPPMGDKPFFFKDFPAPLAITDEMSFISIELYCFANTPDGENFVFVVTAG